MSCVQSRIGRRSSENQIVLDQTVPLLYDTAYYAYRHALGYCNYVAPKEEVRVTIMVNDEIRDTLEQCKAIELYGGW